MRVLVTGATTALGRAVIDALVRAPDVERVVATARALESPLPASVIVEIAELHHAREVHDLVWHAAARHHIDTVIHLASDDVVATRALVRHCLAHPTIQSLVYRSFGEVYAHAHATSELLDEHAALDFDPRAPRSRRDRVESDLYVSSHVGAGLRIAVLRLAEVLAPHSDSQLWAYLSSRLCLRPLGFDPMLNVLSIEDAVVALGLAARAEASGVFNIPGADTLPLSRAIVESGHLQLPLPGPLLGSLDDLRRCHFAGVLDGTLARNRLGYVPCHPVSWPRAWWRVLFERLAELRAS